MKNFYRNNPLFFCKSEIEVTNTHICNLLFIRKLNYIFAVSKRKLATNRYSVYMTQEETNREIMNQFVEFINNGDRNIGENIIAPDVIFYAPTSPEPLRGLEGYIAVLDMMRGAMPDVKWTIEETIAEKDKVMIRFTMTGTQTQPFMGMPATGKSIAITAMNIYQLKDGKIIREHGLPDLFSMLNQLGILPMPQQQK